ncbi:MAG: hypothetical protein RLZ36_1267 [Pseudomonadota bacterium]|jgi:mono/diheme cytochrome c family protein
MHSTSLYVVRTLAATIFLSITTAWADSYKDPTPTAVYIQECGSCHLAFPPNLLPKTSWQRLMNGLDTHYGSDASLDAAVQKQIDVWLQNYGGQSKRAREEPPQDRITRSGWFARKHRELSAATFQRASIKSPTNCTACHRDATRGDFEESRVRIPK